MRKRPAALAALFTAFVLLGVAQMSWGANTTEHKVTLCHATHSVTNPYVQITVDYHSVTQGGHGRHDGPVFFTGIDRKVHWGDIIPAFDFGPGAQYSGMNAEAGQVILGNGCSTEAPTTTIAPETTTTTAEPTTTTTAEPTTTVPEPTTTTTIEAN